MGEFLMYALLEPRQSDASVEPAPVSEFTRDRRRPGRIQNVSPALVPLLRNAAELPIADDSIRAPGPISAALRSIRLLWLSLGMYLLASLGWAGIIATIWCVTGNISWIALAGGIILLFGLGWASCEASNPADRYR
jgi:hypothetical protein